MRTSLAPAVSCAILQLTLVCGDMHEEEEEMDVRELEKTRKVFSGGNTKLKTSKASEKDRLQYVLTKVSPDIVVERLKSALATNVQTRTALALVFDKKTFPPPSTVRCTRCGEDYDPSYNSEEACQEPHDVEEFWMHSWSIAYECARCGKEWEGLPDALVDFGWCFEGPHTTRKRRKRRRNHPLPSEAQ